MAKILKLDDFSIIGEGLVANREKNPKISNKTGWKDFLLTGDVAYIRNVRYGDPRRFVFISDADFVKYDYNLVFKFRMPSKTNGFGGGVFVTFDVYYSGGVNMDDVGGWKKWKLSDFSDDAMLDASQKFEISEIRRYYKTEQPIPIKFFKTKVGYDYDNNSYILYKKGQRNIVESLDIHPVTRERLENAEQERKDINKAFREKNGMYQVGDIVYWMYTYSSVFPKFFKVVRKTKSFIVLVNVGDTVTSGAKNSISYTVRPNLDKIGTEERRAKIGKDGYARIKEYRYETLRVWNGNDIECHCD